MLRHHPNLRFFVLLILFWPLWPFAFILWNCAKLIVATLRKKPAFTSLVPFSFLLLVSGCATTALTSKQADSNKEDAYVESVATQILRTRPRSPQWGLLNLVVGINIRIDESGRTLSVKVTSPSLRPEFDAAIKAHAERLSFAQPPMQLRDELKNKGFDFMICREDCPPFAPALDPQTTEKE